MNRVIGLAVLLILTAMARPASADLTGFVGVTTSQESRPARGFAIGAGLLVLGFEFEYSSTDEDQTGLAPSIRTGMGNVLIQSPVAVLRMQPYFTTGVGFYREGLGDFQETGFGFNTGGGVKVSLVGPLRLRLDYRLFRLGNESASPRSHRLYAGVNLKF